ncbi:MAG: 2-succinyl-6-hydroxy-2,4-cyclohexadiene-1-carboxylate synthase [Alphaproteobacteria bacterium MarineAlpha11_Bin1]|nr:MAG: 2-succinyl-6-hydroxy-2,4-cyclohexadiene-1-carboxylate synthase [Alphaproteobacteria bacterium MarineAlpha11_Bin1]|tara:strand:+ start:1311 stop:2108 length:798 start_codon:yes stop_codon:yes gene_type:complete
MVSQSETLKIAGTEVDVERRGKGRPLMILHGEDGFEGTLPLVDDLAQYFEVFIPHMPGFRKSTLPTFIRGIDDVSYVWLDLLERLELTAVTLLGFSVGGWLAMEMATKNASRIGRMVLTGSVGIKFGDAYDRDIEDIYFYTTETVRKLRFHIEENDPHRDLSNLNKKQALELAKSREAIAKLCWEPYFHTPSLLNRLHRIDMPVQVVWGANDRMTLPKYGRAISRALPNSCFSLIRGAGHFPHIEQPDRFTNVLNDFFADTKGSP